MTDIVQQWNKFSALYEKGKGDNGDKLHQELIAPIIEDFICNSENKIIADLGCGTGFLLENFAKRAKKVYGIDASLKMIEYSRKRISSKNISLISADITESLPLPDHSVDKVILNMVLQYLPTLNQLNQELSRILKSKGECLMVIDHPSHSLFLRAQELCGRENQKFLTHASYFVEGERQKRSLWDKAVLTYYHRTIATYVNTFSSHMDLIKCIEKTDDGETPRILGLVWKNNTY